MDPRKAVAARLILALCLLSPGAPSARAETLTAVSELEVEVWSALIDHGLDADTAMIVIAEQTTGDPAAIAGDPATVSAVVTQLELPQAAFDDWARRNATVELIDRPLDLKVSYQVLNAKSRAALFEAAEPRAGWTAFFARYTGAPGLLRLSHAGFDDTHQHALVYLEHHCGAECGAGRLFHLVRGGQGWTVAGAAVVWMVE